MYKCDRLLVFSKTISNITKRNNSKISYIHNIGEQPLRPLTIGQLLEETCKKHGDTEAVVSCHQNQRFTFKEVLDQADRLAVSLKTIGLNYGDRIAIWAPNCIEWYISFLGCARIGLVTVAVNPAFQPKEMQYCINKVGIKAVIAAHKFKSQNYYDILSHIALDLSKSEPGKLKNQYIPSLESVITISDEELGGTFNYNELLQSSKENDLSEVKKNQDKIKCDDPFNIQFTSGTTGQPKAAVVSHFNLVNNGFIIGKRNELTKKHHKICVQVPLFHAFGTSITISAALNHGATLVLPTEGYDPDKSLDAIKNEKCTIIHGTPTMYVDLVNRQIDRKEDISPEIAISGGASCSPHLFRQMKEHLKLKKVKSVFGLSETTAVVFQSLENDDEYQSTSTVGYISEHTEAKVIDENGNIVPRGVPGELCVRAYANMLGYWGDEKKTKETMGNDRWLKTGDQFVLEENGYGRVVGRLKEMIIRGGENIFPKEIEDYLNTHPKIIETHVIGVPHERLGEEVCACIRITEGSNITLEHIKEFCKGNISHFKIPSKVLVVESFPKTASGKIQKFKIVEQLKLESLHDDRRAQTA